MSLQWRNLPCVLCAPISILQVLMGIRSIPELNPIIKCFVEPSRGNPVEEGSGGAICTGPLNFKKLKNPEPNCVGITKLSPSQ